MSPNEDADALAHDMLETTLAGLQAGTDLGSTSAGDGGRVSEEIEAGHS